MKVRLPIRASLFLLCAALVSEARAEAPTKAPLVQNYAPVVQIEDTELYDPNDPQSVDELRWNQSIVPAEFGYASPAVYLPGMMPPGMVLPAGHQACDPCEGKCTGACGGACEQGCHPLTGLGHRCRHRRFSGILGGLHDGCFRGLFGHLQHHGAGGSCCTPRWFDVAVEGVMLKRDEVSDFVAFTSLGFDTSDPPQPDIVQSTDDLNTDYEPGVRITVTRQVGPGSSAEVIYMGMTHWSASSQYTDDVTRLWSPFSNFGTNPQGIPFIGYDDVDRADFHAISLKSNLNTIEANYRRRWVGPSCLLQGSWIVGFRYLQLSETFDFHTVAPANGDGLTADVPFMDYKVQARNHLYGGQLGADMWFCLKPGLRIGAELKTGIYGNQAEQDTTIFANSINPPQLERKVQTTDAIVGEANLMAVYTISHNFTIRAGFTALYADSLALATENFNSAPPQLFGPVDGAPERVVGIDTNGNALFYGGTLGLEYMW